MKKFSLKNLLWGTVGLAMCFIGFQLWGIAPGIRNLIEEFSMETTYFLFLLEMLVALVGGFIGLIGCHMSIYQFTGISLYQEYVKYIESPKDKVGDK